jgi:hypothetical protein
MRRAALSILLASVLAQGVAAQQRPAYDLKSLPAEDVGLILNALGAYTCNMSGAGGLARCEAVAAAMQRINAQVAAQNAPPRPKPADDRPDDKKD